MGLKRKGLMMARKNMEMDRPLERGRERERERERERRASVKTVLGRSKQVVARSKQTK